MNSKLILILILDELLLGKSYNMFDVCPAPTGKGHYLSTSDSAWTSFDDEPITEACKWSIDDLLFAELRNPSTIDIDPSTIERGSPQDFIYQETNAWGIAPQDIGLIGCNYVYASAEYRNFILQVDTLAEDNDGIGLIFGWHSTTDHFVAHNIDDSWPAPGNAMDGYPGPNMKIKRRFASCVDHQTETDPCFETLAALVSSRGEAENKLSPPTMPSNRYSPAFMPYSLNVCDGVTQPTRYYLIVKDGTARFLRQVPSTGQTVAVWTDNLGASYRGGKIGLMTYAMQAFFYNIKVWDLDEIDVSRDPFCNGRGHCLKDGLCACDEGWDGSACEVDMSQPTSKKSKKSDTDPIGDSSPAVTALVACSFVLNLFFAVGIVALFYKIRGGGYSRSGAKWSNYIEMGQATTENQQYRSPLSATVEHEEKHGSEIFTGR